LHEYYLSVFIFALLFRAVAVPRTFFQEYRYRVIGKFTLNNLIKMVSYLGFIETLPQALISPDNSAKGSAPFAGQLRFGPLNAGKIHHEMAKLSPPVLFLGRHA
jgi:hypothetical protein